MNLNQIEEKFQELEDMQANRAKRMASHPYFKELAEEKKRDKKFYEYVYDRCWEDKKMDKKHWQESYRYLQRVVTKVEEELRLKKKKKEQTDPQMHVQMHVEEKDTPRPDGAETERTEGFLRKNEGIVEQRERELRAEQKQFQQFCLKRQHMLSEIGVSI